MPDVAEILIHNAKIKTMDADHPVAEAVALAGNRVLAVGTDAEILPLKGDATRVVDAKGATVMPGFNDAHVHLFVGGVGLEHLPLIGVHGFEALKEAILTYAEAHPDEELLCAEWADYAILGDEGPVTRHHLDKITDRPFIMTASDNHTAWANTAALKLGGILEGAELSVGNEVVMGEDGLATGELQENEAIIRVRKFSTSGFREGLGMATGGEPETLSAEDRANDLETVYKGMLHLAENGVTSMQNMDGNHYQLELVQEIRDTRGLPVRVRFPFHYKNFHSPADLEDKAVKWREEFNDDMIRMDFMKMFIDGVIESGTAVLVEDYSDTPGWKGDPLFTQDKLEEAVAAADKLGFQVAIHSIGDGGVNMVINAYEQAQATNGTRDSRHRIEHIETILPTDIPRIAELGILASMQPLHCPGSDMFGPETYLPKIGKARAEFAFPARSIKEAGAYMVYSTDWPVVPVDPMLSVQASLTRKPWFPEFRNETLTLDETLEAYTLGGAYAEFMEDRKGMLKPGYLADVVVLSDDIEAVAPGDLTTIKPLLTICDGKITFEAA